MITTTPPCGATCKRGILQKWHRKGCYTSLFYQSRFHNKVPYGAIRVVESKPFNIKIYFVLTMIYSIFIITCPMQKKRKNHDFFSYKYAKTGHKAYVSTFSFANVKNMLQ